MHRVEAPQPEIQGIHLDEVIRIVRLRAHIHPDDVEARLRIPRSSPSRTAEQVSYPHAMSVGNVANESYLNDQLTQLALGLRNTCQAIGNLNTFINGQGQGFATLEALGFGSADATAFLANLAYMNTIAGVYKGTVQQGGTGGTGAIDYDFDNQLAPLWAGQ